MNRKATPLLLAATLLLGIAAWWSHRSHPDGPGRSPSRAGLLLPIHPQDLIQVRLRRDFWNTFTLARGADTAWELIEPAREPADAAAVEVLLQTLTSLPVIRRIDLPGDDTEHYRQYGLWEPRLTVQVLTGHRQEVLQFGDETSDGTGVYCIREGVDGVFITSAAAFSALETEPDKFRSATPPG